MTKILINIILGTIFTIIIVRSILRLHFRWRLNTLEQKIKSVRDIETQDSASTNVSWIDKHKKAKLKLLTLSVSVCKLRSDYAYVSLFIGVFKNRSTNRNRIDEIHITVQEEIKRCKEVINQKK
ncbi:MAG: hypothetical protein ACI88L_000715 [Candidatus Paceibacteria bacterium]|jgi:hypothetical protein